VLALSTLSPLGITGCLVAEAPEYGSPQRSPIFMFNVKPNTGSLQELNRMQVSVPFGATVRSEDAGEQIVATFFFDYKHADERSDSWVLPPLTIEQDRDITFHVTPSRDFQETNTCHTITLMVTHLSSWDQIAKRFKGPPEDLASATWFISVNDEGITLVKDCPTASTESPQ